MWKVVEHNHTDGKWTDVVTELNPETLVGYVAQFANRYIVWGDKFPADEKERDKIIQMMFQLNNEQVHSVFVGAQIKPLRDIFDIRDPKGPCGSKEDPCFCVRPNLNAPGYCLTSYPLVDGSFNIKCNGGSKCY